MGEALFGRHERHGVIGPDDLSQRFPRIRIESGREIDSQDSCRTGIDAANDVIPRRPNSPGQACSEQSIHDPLRLLKLSGERITRRKGSHRQTGLVHDAVMNQSIAVNLRLFATAVNVNRDAMHIEMAGDDKPIAAIVPPPANDVDGSFDPKLQQDIRGAATGVLHEHRTRHPVSLNRLAIELADLLAAQGGVRHGYRN
jgi:hypothetical protein